MIEVVIAFCILFFRKLVMALRVTSGEVSGSGFPAFPLFPGDFSVKYFDHLSWLAWDIVALDVQDVIFIVDSDNLESDLFADLAPHVSRHLLSWPDSALVPSGPDATRPPVGLSRTTNIMTTTLETPTFHYALVASTR